MAEVKGDLLANPPDGRLQLLVWDDKGMGMLRRNSINVIGYVACFRNTRTLQDKSGR